MARYREYSPEQARLLPVSLSRQIQPGTFEYTVNYLVDHCVDLKVFESLYCNDHTGAPAINPSVLLKVILLAYSRGMISSRCIARCCEENVLFMALSADTRPHFCTVAQFVSSMANQIISIFRDVVAVCYSEGLIGKRMFAIDGCKISSNCAKEWSGTKKELQKKAEKLEQSMRMLVQRHRQEDEREEKSSEREREKRTIQTLEAKAKKIQSWLAQSAERIGTQGKPVKSNITDNESAKMPSSHGVIQGYNGIATVDDKHQVVVDAQAFGEGHEAQNLTRVLESVQSTLVALGEKSDGLHEVVLTADSGFHSEASVGALLDGGMDAYIADTRFRQRDARFAGVQEYKRKGTDRHKTSMARKYFRPEDFAIDEASGELVCPAGKRLRRCATFRSKGYRGISYIADGASCKECTLRGRCIRKPNTPARQVTKLERGMREDKKSNTQKMIERFDSPRGRSFYRRRMGTVEPVFANIRACLGLDRFTLRGRKKVDIQWKLFCLVHNIGKISRLTTL